MSIAGKDQEVLKIKKVEEVEVIRVISYDGDGTEKSPVRKVVRYWGKNGQYIGKIDDKSQVRENA